MKQIARVPIMISAVAIASVLIGLLCVPSMRAQAPSNLTFEAATLKEQPPDDGQVGTFFTYAGGRMTLRGCTLQFLIWNAYKVQSFQVLNAPAWANETRYNIEAVPPRISILDNYKPSNPKFIPPDVELTMLQKFLGERFHLKVHEELRDASGYAIIRGDRALRLNEPADKTARPVVVYGVPGGGDTAFYRQGFNASMADLSEFLSRDLRAPVADQTGIQGSYDFRFEFTPDPSDPTPGGYVFQAIQQIGLKLKPIKIPARNIIVDQAEKPMVDR